MHIANYIAYPQDEARDRFFLTRNWNVAVNKLSKISSDLHINFAYK